MENEVIQGKCNVWLIDKQPAGKKELKGDELFNNSVALSVFEKFRKKMWWFWRGGNYKSYKSWKYNRTLHQSISLRKAVEWSRQTENWNHSVTIGDQFIRSIPRIASKVLNLCLKMFKDAFPTDSVDRMDTEKVKLEIVWSDNPFEILNNRKRSYTYEFFPRHTDVVYIARSMSMFWRVVRKEIGFVHDCMVMYSRDEKEKAMRLTKEAQLKGIRKEQVGLTTSWYF